MAASGRYTRCRAAAGIVGFGGTQTNLRDVQLRNVNAGATVPVLERRVAVAAGAAHIYTECSRIWNPIHTDPRTAARAQGRPAMRCCVLPHPMESRPEAEVRAIARARLRELVAALAVHGVEDFVLCPGSRSGPVAHALVAAASAAGEAYDDGSVLDALWDLVWAGEVTNDTLAPLRAFVRGASASAARVSRSSWSRAALAAGEKSVSSCS